MVAFKIKMGWEQGSSTASRAFALLLACRARVTPECH